MKIVERVQNIQKLLTELYYEMEQCDGVGFYILKKISVAEDLINEAIEELK